jgi:3-hydroxyisobutyrate dehydrogenase-like beta-hydroxyacid dehydrogenase
MSTRGPVVGILYPGEMGAAVCALLVQRGADVVTTLQGRGDATAARAAACGAQVLDSVAHVVRRADVVVSLVVPSAAQAVARAYCDAADLAPADAIYVDANSVGPDKAAAMAKRVEACGRAFVDASINGLARNLTAGATLYLSGRRAGEVATLFDGAVRVQVLGAEAGRASAMKMLLGGLSKGMCALFAELAVLAERRGMLEEMLEATTRTYPGVMTVVGRMLPTYPRHAGRRETEMTELGRTARGAGMDPRVIDAVRALHEDLALRWPGPAPAAGPHAPDVAALVRELSGLFKHERAVEGVEHHGR